MKIETILNALELSNYWGNSAAPYGDAYDRYLKQRVAFRARIIKMFEEKDRQLAILEEDKWNLKDEIRVKDARIAELKAENQAMEYLLNEGENIGVE